MLHLQGQGGGTGRAAGQLPALGHSLGTCHPCVTYPGCLGHLTAPTTPLLRAQGDFVGQMLLIEDAPSPSQEPGCQARVLPQSQVWQGLCQARERGGSKRRRAGWSWWDHCRGVCCILLPAQGQSLQPCHVLSMTVQWMAEEERVSVPCPPWVGDPEASRILGSTPSQSPALGSPKGSCLPETWVKEQALGKASAGAFGSVTRVCLASSVGSRLEKLEKITATFKAHLHTHCRAISGFNLWSAPGAEKHFACM